MAYNSQPAATKFGGGTGTGGNMRPAPMSGAQPGGNLWQPWAMQKYSQQQQQRPQRPVGQADPRQMAAMQRMMQGGQSLRSLYQQQLPGMYTAAGMQQPTPYGPGHPVWQQRNRPPRWGGGAGPGVPVGNKPRAPLPPRWGGGAGPGVPVGNKPRAQAYEDGIN